MTPSERLAAPESQRVDKITAQNIGKVEINGPEDIRTLLMRTTGATYGALPVEVARHLECGEVESMNIYHCALIIDIDHRVWDVYTFHVDKTTRRITDVFARRYPGSQVISVQAEQFLSQV